MSTQKEVNPDKIFLEDVLVLNTNIDASEDFYDEPKDYNDFGLSLIYQFAYNLEDEKIRVRLYITLDANFDNTEDVWLKTEYNIEFHFFTKDLNEYAENDNGEMNVDENFAATLLSIAYSTARGIVLERSRGTIFGPAVLPVVNPYEVLQGNSEEDESS